MRGRGEHPPAAGSAGCGTLAESVEEIVCQPPRAFPLGVIIFPECAAEVRSHLFLLSEPVLVYQETPVSCTGT